MSPCSHEQEIDCGVPIKRSLEQNRCCILVDNTFLCGQKVTKPCYKAPKCVCKDICRVPLDCGHNCGKICHAFDNNSVHDNITCKKQCSRPRDCGHLC